MSAPSEEKLLKLGVRKLSETGVRGMKVRRMCAEAQVSPGTFTAYFGTLEQFTERVLLRWYEPFREAIHRHAEADGNAYERLMAELREGIRFLRSHANVILQLLIDAGEGNIQSRRMLQHVQGEHIAMVIKTIEEAQAGGFLIPGEPTRLMLYLMGAVNFPVLAFHQFPKGVVDEIPLYTALLAATDEEECMQRLEWAMKGIRL